MIIIGYMVVMKSCRAILASGSYSTARRPPPPLCGRPQLAAPVDRPQQHDPACHARGACSAGALRSVHLGALCACVISFVFSVKPIANRDRAARPPALLPAVFTRCFCFLGIIVAHVVPAGCCAARCRCCEPRVGGARGPA